MRYVKSASTSEVSPGEMAAVSVEDQKLLLANVDGTFYAIQRKCPHMGADLCKGKLEGFVVTCRMHGASFDVRNGEVLGGAKLLFFKMKPKAAATFPVKVEDDQISIGV